MSGEKSLGYGRAGEAVSLQQNLRAGFVDLADDCIGSAPARGKIDVYRPGGTNRGSLEWAGNEDRQDYDD